MKVKDLIAKLQTLDPEMVVVRSGYEGGYSEIDGIVEPRVFVKNVNPEWYYGPHELDTEYLDQTLHADKPRFYALTVY